MWPFKPKLCVKDIETSFGQMIIKTLAKDGWAVKTAYSEDMFDKGIDFDSYTLTDGQNDIVFTWTIGANGR